MSEATYKMTKFGVRIEGFDGVFVRIISPNRGLVYDSTMGLVSVADWRANSNSNYDDTVITGDDTDLDVLGVYVVTIPADLPAGNDYDVLYYSVAPDDTTAPYDGRHMVWDGDSIVSLTDYVGTSIAFKSSPFGGGFGF